MKILMVLLFSLQQLWASPYFTNLRDDFTVPEKCQDVQLQFFNFPAEKFYVGRKGSLAMGYTIEYPVSRSNATILWRYFKGMVSGNEDSQLLAKINSSPELKRDYDIIIANYYEQGFDFGNEGEILEVLAIQYLYEEFPENMYFITGGVKYHKAYSPQTIGELDLFVGRRDTCESIAVGEAKLGTRKMLNKAKRQIGRFEDFLIDHNGSGLGEEYKPRR